MTKSRRNLAVAVTLCAIGGSLLGATSAMAADHTPTPNTHAAHAAHGVAQAPEPTVEVTTVSPDESTNPTATTTASDTDTDAASDPAPDAAPADSEDAAGSTWISGVGTPEYLDLLKTDKDVDDAQIQIVDFMKARGLQVQLSYSDATGRPYAEYDTFVPANGEAVDAYWDARLAQAKAQG